MSSVQLPRFLSQFLFVGLIVASLSTQAAPVQVSVETSQGNFVLELYPDKAPKTVENFLRYAKEGFYENTIFHRVIGTFMIQGGGFTREMAQKDTHAPIVNESNNGLTNQIGTIAMARTNDPNSATSQFFINVADNQPLNYMSPDPDMIGYCVFGKVTSGMDVVYQISKSPTRNYQGFSDVPIRTVTIKHVNVVTAKQ